MTPKIYYYNKDWNFEKSQYIVLYTNTADFTDHLILYSDIQVSDEHIGSGTYRIVASQPIERYSLSEFSLREYQIRLK